MDKELTNTTADVKVKKKRIYKKCEHGRLPHQCADCGGKSTCEHKKRRSQCADCGGKSTCEHKKRRSQCADCGGSSICVHRRHRAICIDCDGKSICEHKKRYNECKDCNISVYLVNVQRKNLNRILKRTTIIKTGHSIDYLGCESSYFKEYIKSKMTDGMNWDNIHLDHIKPISKFNLGDENELKDCCHYTNLQPLLAKDNLNKNNKWSEIDELFWIANIKQQEYIQLYIPL
jgi:hypothetical protein